MKWQDKLAVLKIAGYNFEEVEQWKEEPQGYYRWIVTLETPQYIDRYTEASDDLEELVLDAYRRFKERFPE